MVAVVAVVVSRMQSPAYEGEATVLLTQQNAGTSLLGSHDQQLTDTGLQREVQTQVDVMRSRALLTEVINELNLDMAPADLAKHITITSSGQTNIITIDVLDASPDSAAAIANSLAQSYVVWSRDRQRRSIQAAVDDLDTRIATAQKQIVTIQAAISGGDKSGARQVQLQAANSLYRTLSDQLEQLKINEQLVTGSGSVLSSASPDPAAVSPKPVRNGALGLALGLILGLALVVVVETLDNTVKSNEDAEQAYGAPVLTAVPIEKAKNKETVGLTLVEHPAGPGAEAYRMLRNNLDFINFEHDIKTILITSAVPMEGKSTVAANLATVLASAGKRVILVIADFHRPTSNKLFGLENTFGLSDVLSGERQFREVLRQNQRFENLWVLPSGSMPPNPSELLGSVGMAALLANLRDSADWVIVDSAPLLAVADAAAMARQVDGVIMVTRANVSNRDSARKARAQLDNVGARILGVALWGIEDASSLSGYGGYNAGYGARPAK